MNFVESQYNELIRKGVITDGAGYYDKFRRTF